MNIGIIVSSFEKGGAQRVAITLSKWLEQHGNKSILIALNKSRVNEYQLNGLENIVLENLYPKKNVGQRIRSFDLDNKIDVYLVMGVPMCVYVIPALKKSTAKIIVSERSDPQNAKIKLPVKILSRYYMRKANGFVFQAEGARDFYKKIDKTRSTLIPNPLTDIPVVEKRTSNERRKKEIVTAGRLIEAKNHKMLLRAFCKVSPSFPEYKLIIFGDGILLSELKALAKKLNIEKKTIFKGSVSNVHEQMLDSELFVLSSNYEGMPNALMEAMGLGLTCISTDCPCGCAREIVENGKNGYLIPVGNVDICAKTIINALQDKEKANAMGNAAMKVKEKYASDVICLKWLEYIKEVSEEDISIH